MDNLPNNGWSRELKNGFRRPTLLTDKRRATVRGERGDISSNDFLEGVVGAAGFCDGMKYGAAIGPGVYDIHSPRIPSTEEIVDRIIKMLAILAGNILWVNPDCGLEPLIIIIIIIIIIMFLPFILSKDV